MTELLRVLIVEDDFRIADIHQQFIEKRSGFIVQKKVKTAQEAFTYLDQCDQQPHLILLDLYIPDVTGLDLFWKLRMEYQDIDIVIVTAEKEMKTIATTIRAGVFDYMIKPADVRRFEQTLIRYQQQHDFLATKQVLEQEDIDRMIGLNEFRFSSSSFNSDLPKGIDSITLDKMKDLFKTEKVTAITAVELSEKIGTSRSTSRRYLEYLVSTNEVETKLIYGTVGRPERQYIVLS